MGVSVGVLLQEDFRWDYGAHRADGSYAACDAEDWKEQGRSDVQISRGTGAEGTALALAGEGEQTARK